MKLSQFIAKSRIIDLESRDLRGALEELLESVPLGKTSSLEREKLVEALMLRENTMATYLGNGVALPHIRIPMKRSFMFAVGRSKEGFLYEGYQEKEPLHLIVVLLANESARNYLQVLSSLARLFRDKSLVQSLVDSATPTILRERVMRVFGGVTARPAGKQNSINRLILKQAERVARGSKSSSVLVFGDTFTHGYGFSFSFPQMKTVLVTSNLGDNVFEKKQINATIQVGVYSRQRLAQLRSAILIGLTRGLFSFSDRLTCVGGLPGSNQFDTVVMIDIEREFQSIITEQGSILPADVKPEVFERVIGIATELAVEGREGHPVGTMFVLGDHVKVETMVKPLVLNPFYGYPEEDRNILNPFMDETVKEFSSIDGAFIVRGDGVIESAGSLVHAPEYVHQLPSGLGTRHAAGAAISMVSECIAIVISSSTGQVTLFRKGVMLPLLDKSAAGTR
jgi:diadenylate cyclase